MHREMLKIVRQDRVCQRLNDHTGRWCARCDYLSLRGRYPSRFTKSQTVGAYFGLMPKKYQSGDTDLDGGISRVGDTMVRTALYEAAHIYADPCQQVLGAETMGYSASIWERPRIASPELLPKTWFVASSNLLPNQQLREL